MSDFLCYLWRWLKTAFTHSVGVFDLWMGLISAALGVIDHYWPKAQIMTTFAWQIPVWALAGVMLVRLIMAPYWIYKNDHKNITRLGDNKKSEVVPRTPNSICIIIGSGPNYETAVTYNQNSVTRTLSVGVKNIDESHYISNCKLYLDIQDQNGKKTYLLVEGFTLNPSEERFVRVAYRHEYVCRDGKVDCIIFPTPLPPGGFFGVHHPTLPVGTHFITLRATAIETKDYEILCKVWVDEQGRLRLEKP